MKIKCVSPIRTHEWVEPWLSTMVCLSRASWRSHPSPSLSNYRTRISSSARAMSRASFEELLRSLLEKREERKCDDSNIFRYTQEILHLYKRSNSHCIFLLWKRGLPRKLFLILVNLVFHNWLPLVPEPFGSIELFIICEPVGGGSIADLTIGSLSQKLFGIIMGPELARWWTGEVVHDDVVRRLLLLLLRCCGVPKLSIWFFIRPDGCRIGVFVDAGDDGRKTPVRARGRDGKTGF